MSTFFMRSLILLKTITKVALQSLKKMFSCHNKTFWSMKMITKCVNNLGSVASTVIPHSINLLFVQLLCVLEFFHVIQVFFGCEMASKLRTEQKYKFTNHIVINLIEGILAWSSFFQMIQY